MSMTLILFIVMWILIVAHSILLFIIVVGAPVLLLNSMLKSNKAPKPMGAGFPYRKYQEYPDNHIGNILTTHTYTFSDRGSN